MKRFFGGRKTGNKFGATKSTYNGIEFDSIYEKERYIYLLDLQKQGLISQLRLKTKFTLIPQTTKIVPVELKTKVKYVEKVVEQDADYHNDFTYIENGVYVCEEFKSEYTAKLADYILRRKLMVNKIYIHNMRKHGKWVFREVVYYAKRKNLKVKVTDK